VFARDTEAQLIWESFTEGYEGDINWSRNPYRGLALYDLMVVASQDAVAKGKSPFTFKTADVTDSITNHDIYGVNGIEPWNIDSLSKQRAINQMRKFYSISSARGGRGSRPHTRRKPGDPEPSDPNAPVKFVFPKDKIYPKEPDLDHPSTPWSEQDPSQFLNKDGTPNWEKIRANLVQLALKLPDLDPTPDGTGTEPGKLSAAMKWSDIPTTAEWSHEDPSRDSSS
jgi:hypothetical protein